MDAFGNSAWAKAEFSRNYLEKADIYILERKKMIALTEAGFLDVDCYFKIGIFVVFGGKKI